MVSQTRTPEPLRDSLCVCVDTPPRTPSAEDAGDERGEGISTATGSEGETAAAVEVARLNLQPPTEKESHYDPNRWVYREKRFQLAFLSSLSLSLRYKLHFQRESGEEVERRKLRAQTETLSPVAEVGNWPALQRRDIPPSVWPAE